MRSIRIVFLIAVATVFSTAFVVNDSLLFGDVVAKYFWFATVMCFVSLLIPFHISKKNEVHIADILFCILAVYVCFNYFFLNGHANMRWWLTLLMIPLYVFFRGFLRTEKENRVDLHALLMVVFLLMALWGGAQLHGFVQSYHTQYKITGAFFNPGPYSGFLSLGVPLSLDFALDKTLPHWKRWLGFACLISILLVLPATMSRAAWIAAVVGGLIVLWKKYRFFSFIKNGKSKIVHYLSVAVVCVLIMVLLVGAYSIKKDSVAGRLMIWAASVEVIKENSLFGVGYGRFAAVYGDAQAAYFLKQERTLLQIMTADVTEYAFNEYVQFAVELGMVGLLLFLLTTGSVLICKGRFFDNDLRNRCVSASLVSLLVFAAFSYPFSVLSLGVFFVIFLALLSPSSWKLPFVMPVWLQVLVVAACWGITAYGASQILSKRDAYYVFSELQMLRDNHNLERTSKQYAALYPRLCHDKFFLFEYGRFLSMTGQHKESNRIFREYFYYGNDPMVYNYTGYNLKELGEYQKAEDAYIRALQIVPNRFYPLYMLMKLYQETGHSENAKIVADILLTKPIKVPSAEIQQILEEARMMMSE